MAIYDWPTSRVFLPQTCELRVVDNTQRTLESPLSGYVQTISMPGARWGWSLGMPAQSVADRSTVEGFLLRLSGREHRARIWDLKRPRPLGNIGTSGVTLASAAAQFATSLQLTGCVGVNRVLNGSFETDTNADNLADGWALFVGGAGDVSRAYVRSRVPTVAAAHGTAVQFIQISAAGNSLDSGIVTSPRATLVSGQQYTLSAQIRASVSGKVILTARVYDVGGSSLGDFSTATVPATGGLVQAAVSFVAPAGAVTADVAVRGINAVSEFFEVDAVQLVPGNAVGSYSGPATLLAGDWLGLVGGQLVRVVANATADDLGVMSVEVRHMLRAAVSSGTAVTLERPTALYVRTESGLSLPRQPGAFEPELAAEFVEVFA